MKQTAFTKWLDLFISEKGIDLEESFTLDGPSGVNYMNYGVVVEFMKIAPKHEQKAIKNMIVVIDFKNADVKHYFRHLAQALVK